MRYINLRPFLLILLGFSGLVWFVVATISGLNLQDLFDFMRPIPNVVTADLILVAVFVRWGWRWKYFQGWLVPFPDLNGTWIGNLQTTWKDEQGNTPGPIPVMLSVHQSFAHLSCVMRTAEMASHSYVEGFWIDQDRQIWQLCYTYTSKPKSSLRDRSTPHDGTAVLNIIGNPIQKLEGEYWTQRKTTGSIALSFKSKKILDDLSKELLAHPMSTQGTSKTANPAVQGTLRDEAAQRP